MTPIDWFLAVVRKEHEAIKNAPWSVATVCVCAVAFIWIGFHWAYKAQMANLVQDRDHWKNESDYYEDLATRSKTIDPNLAPSGPNRAIGTRPLTSAGVEPVEKPVYPALAETITLSSEFDLPAFWAKCSVPCFFNRGVVVGSNSEMSPLSRDKDDLTIVGVRVIKPARLRKGQKLILEYMAFGGGPIKLVAEGRILPGRTAADSARPCANSNIHIGEMVNNNVGEGIVTHGSFGCIDVDKETTTNGKAGLDVDPSSSAPSPPTKQ